QEKHQAEGKTITPVFVTGATGAIGRHLVPGLVARVTRSPPPPTTAGKVAQLRVAGAEPVVVDGLDREAVIPALQARRAGGDRAPDDRAGRHAEPPQPRQGVRRHQRAPDPGPEEDPLHLRPIRSAVQGPAAIAYVENGADRGAGGRRAALSAVSEK